MNIVIAKKASFWEVVDGKQKRISKARFDEILSQKIVKTEKRENETVYHVEEVELFSFEHLKEDFQHTLELLGFSNINSRFEKKGVSFTADFDARNIVNDSQKWQSQQAFEYFSPFMRIMCKLGGKAKIAERCITADSVLEELVLEEMYNNICNIYHSKLLYEYEYLISDKAVKDHFLSCKNGLCVNG